MHPIAGQRIVFRWGPSRGSDALWLVYVCASTGLVEVLTLSGWQAGMDMERQLETLRGQNAVIGQKLAAAQAAEAAAQSELQQVEPAPCNPTLMEKEKQGGKGGNYLVLQTFPSCFFSSFSCLFLPLERRRRAPQVARNRVIQPC